MNKELDWPRIAHLMKIGIAAALMVLVGDMLLGWGVHDVAKPGMEGFLSAYLNLSDGRIFWSALLGLIGIPLEALCYFAVYRLIAPYSSRLAHLYRSGIIGVLAFGGCGVHIPCLACVFFYACNGNLTGSTGRQRKLMRMASREAYAMLKAQGIPILPEGDDQYYAPGIKDAVMQLLYFGMAKWKTAGDLIACEHCRNAFEEMEMLDEEFEKVLARKPEFPMPNWRELKAQMPDWDAIRKQYTKEA